MASYAVGDIQGCLDSLKELLDKVGFSSADCLWVAGDLVNRGPKSLETLRFIHALGAQAQVVLGNHDLHLLALYSNQTQVSPTDTLAPIFSANDGPMLLHWLQQQPLLHYDQHFDTVMTHAGVPPCWDLVKAQELANELHDVLRGSQASFYFKHMYGAKPALWHDQLEGMDRWRCITNHFTRMRFLNADGSLDLSHKTKAGSKDKSSASLTPWFMQQGLVTARQVFGHWAALEGETGLDQVINLDMGCVWGGRLKLMRLEDGQCFSVACETLK